MFLILMEKNNYQNHELGNNNYILGNYDTAINLYLQIQNYDKQHIIYSNIAACYLSLKNYIKALDYGLQSVDNKLKYSVGWGRIGSAYKGLQMYKDSYKAFHIASLMNPDNINYHNELLYLEKKNIINLNYSEIFKLFLNNNILLEKLKNKDFRNLILNSKNSNDILNNKNIKNILDSLILNLN
jgi:tetratricopeptide (TPR) repeat protein